MELLSISPSQLAVGMSLSYNLRDGSGLVLLAKGQKIETEHQLAGLLARGDLFLEVDQGGEGRRLVSAGLAELERRDAPLKDIDKYIPTQIKAAARDDVQISLVQSWNGLESRLNGLLGQAQGVVDYPQKLDACQAEITQLLNQDTEGSLLVLLYRSVSGYNSYSVQHALICAVLSHLLAPRFGLDEAQQASLVKAALTMNVAMTALQDQLALQQQPPSPHQREQINLHASKGKQVLQSVGVTDPLWLGVVAKHHADLPDPGTALSTWPAGPRMTRILQVVDRYTAAMSPRKSRSGRTAKDSARTVIVQAGEKQDEVGVAVLQMLGLSPAGTFVKLANGETAVVLRRGVRPNEPFVASVLNRNDDPIAEPRMHNTARPNLHVAATIPATQIKLRLNLDLMLKLLGTSRAGTMRDSLVGVAAGRLAR